MNLPQDSCYDDAVTAIRSHADDLGVWLTIWQARQEDAPDPHARRCASDSIDAIDAAIRELHTIRARLIGEVRRSDDQTAARVDALLAGLDPDDLPGPSGPAPIRSRGQRGRALGTPGRKEPERSGDQVTITSGVPIGVERQQVIPPEPRAAVTTLRGKYSPDNPVAYGAPVMCPRYVPGEKITSVVQGTNADLMREAAKLWICPEDRLIDVTAGKGTFWSDTDVQPVRSDIRLLPGIDLIADCRKLPYRNASVDVVVFDPPYQPVHGQPERSFGVGRSYGLNEGPVVLQTINYVLGFYEAGIAECARVLVPGGRLLVKCQDMTHNHRLQLVNLDVLRRMTAAGVDLADQLILVNKSRMPQRTQRQQRAHRAHSYLWVGVKARQRITRLPGRRPGSGWSCGITRAASTGSFTVPR